MPAAGQKPQKKTKEEIQEVTARPADTHKSRHYGVVFIKSQSETEIFTFKRTKNNTGVTQCESSGAGILPGSRQPSQSNLTKNLL